MRRIEFLGCKRKFLSKITKTDSCWLFSGCPHPDGHHYFNALNSSFLAHRVSYLLHVGEIGLGEKVLHRCGIANCVNPDHLYIGTSKQNTADAFRHGTFLMGEKSPLAKINDAIVREIRSKTWQPGEKAAYARNHGVSAGTISLVLSRKIWKHVQ